MARQPGYDYDGGGTYASQTAGDMIRMLNGEMVDNTQLKGGETFDWDTFKKWGRTFAGWQSPDPEKDLGEYLGNISFDALRNYQNQHKSMAVRFNPDGTVTYDPTQRVNKYSYEPREPFLDTYLPMGMLALGGAGLAGLLPGTTSIFSGLGESLGSLFSPGAESFSMSSITPELVSSGSEVLGGFGAAADPFASAGAFGASANPFAFASDPMAASLLAGPTTNLGVAPFSAGITSSAVNMPSLLGGTFDLGGLGSFTVDAAGNLLPNLVNLGNTAAGLVPTAGGGGGGSGVGGGGTSLTDLLKPGASPLASLLGLGENGQNWLSLLGGLGATGLGAYAANKQSDALKDIADQARQDRLPALNAFNSALTNPNSWYSSAPAMGAVDGVLRQLSAQHGNPSVNPTALSQAAAYNLGGYNDYLRTTGGLGLSGQEGIMRAQTNAALGDTNFYNALGSGLNQLTQPQQSPLMGALGKFLLP